MPDFPCERKTTTTKRIVRTLVLVWWAECQDHQKVLLMKPSLKGQLSLHRDLLRAHPVCFIMFVSFSALSPRAGPLTLSTIIITIIAVYHCYQKAANMCCGTRVVKWSINCWVLTPCQPCRLFQRLSRGWKTSASDALMYYDMNSCVQRRSYRKWQEPSSNSTLFTTSHLAGEFVCQSQ